MQCQNCQLIPPMGAKFCAVCGGKIILMALKSEDNSLIQKSRMTYSVKEVAELIGVSKGLIYTEVKKGKLAHVPVGDRKLIPYFALSVYLEAQKTEEEDLKVAVASNSNSAGRKGSKKP